MPTIPVRDLAIQKRENDLVLATFGRGFYVLDDYSALREISEESISKDALLFTPRKALLYNPMRGGTSSGGGANYFAKNPPYGAVISYYLKKSHLSLKEKRQKSELPDKVDYSVIQKLADAGYKTPQSIMEQDIKSLSRETDIKKKELKELFVILESRKTKDIPFPGWEAYDAELQEIKSNAILVIKNSDGETVDQITGPLKKGVHSVSWGLNTKTPTVSIGSRSRDIYKQAKPGTYSVILYKRIDGELKLLAGPTSFEVERIRKGMLTNPIADKHEVYSQSIVELTKKVNTYSHLFTKANKRLSAYQKNLSYVKTENTILTKEVYALINTMNQLKKELNGSPAKDQVGEKNEVSISSRLWKARGPNNSYGPTELHMQSFTIAETLFNQLQPKMDSYFEKIKVLGKSLEEAGAPEVLD